MRRQRQSGCGRSAPSQCDDVLLDTTVLVAHLRREILELTKQAGVTLRLARVKPEVHELLTRDGFFDRLGGDKTHGNVSRAVDAQIDDAGHQLLSREGTTHPEKSHQTRQSRTVADPMSGRSV